MTSLLAQATRPPLEWDWVLDNTGRLWDATYDHLTLTGLSVLIGVVVALALAVLALRWPRAYDAILSFTGVLYTVPSLAAFALLVPFFGFGLTAALIPLVTYTLMILVKNIVDGINDVPAEVVEAARGMGYRPARLLFTVQLPLALPVIIAGIRVATVTIIGLVTVTSLLGMNNLGQLILSGFRSLPIFPTLIVMGTLLSVLLAIVLDLLLLATERLLTPWARRHATV